MLGRLDRWGGVEVTVLVLGFFSGRLPSLTVNKPLVKVLVPRIAGWTKLCYWVKLSHIFAVPHCAPHFVAGLLGVLVHFVPGRSRLRNP